MKKLDILYEDKELLVVNKPTKMLTISDGKTMDSLYHMAREYVKKQHKSNQIFIVHRLDRDTSGVVLFAKNEKIKKYLQDHWNQVTKREYLAIVSGVVKEDKDVIEEYLQEDKTHRVFVSHKNHGEYAKTLYEVVKRNKNNTVLKIEIKTGKKHQIRVGLSHLGYPILGDKKYGSKESYFNRLGLHATRLELKINNELKIFEAKIPNEFKKYL